MVESISKKTSAALVGDGLPEIFADGAAIGVFAVAISLFAILSDGYLTATVSPPAVDRIRY